MSHVSPEEAQRVVANVAGNICLALGLLWDALAATSSINHIRKKRLGDLSGVVVLSILFYTVAAVTRSRNLLWGGTGFLARMADWTALMIVAVLAQEAMTGWASTRARKLREAIQAGDSAKGRCLPEA